MLLAKRFLWSVKSDLNSFSATRCSSVKWRQTWELHVNCIIYYSRLEILLHNSIWENAYHFLPFATSESGQCLYQGPEKIEKSVDNDQTLFKRRIPRIFPSRLRYDLVDKLQNFLFQIVSIISRPRRVRIMIKARWLGIFALAFIATFITKECSGQSESLLRVGKGINVFIRYGYLSISMKVISYNDTERWIFKEPTKNIFQVNKPSKFNSWRRRKSQSARGKLTRLNYLKSMTKHVQSRARKKTLQWIFDSIVYRIPLNLDLSFAGSLRAGDSRGESHRRIQRRLPHGVLW